MVSVRVRPEKNERHRLDTLAPVIVIAPGYHGHAIPAAETLFPQSRDDVVEFSKDVTFPVMLKGIDTLALRERTGVKMVVAEDAKTLLRLYDEMEAPEAPNLMLQEYLSGGSRTV